MRPYKSVVFDIGKTNKKLFVYDSDLNCLNPDEEGAVFDLVERGIEGVPVVCDDVESIWRWMVEALTRAAREYDDIRVISISTHGATIALPGRGDGAVFEGDGGLVFPVISYTNDIGDDAGFFRDVGATLEELQRSTATARFGWLINYGKQVWWLGKRFPERFARVTDILMYPQYFGYLLTGSKGIEPTSPGCHGYLLDASGKKYSIVAEALGVAHKLPPLPLSPSWKPLGTLQSQLAALTGLSPEVIVTMGVHDSNAALVPYFVRGYEDFVVQDSGTWVVTMSPREEPVFAADELGKEVFFNRSVYNTPVKTTIFRGGAEFDFYRTKVLPHAPHPEGVNLDLLREVLEDARAFALPTIDRGSGLFPESVARLVGVDTVFRDAETAWCVVDLGLAIQGYEAVRMAGGASPSEIFIEGNIGRKNALYRSAISTLFPERRVCFGGSGGAAYGAAILAAAAVEGVRPEALADRCRIDETEIPKLALPPGLLEAYVSAFLRQLG